MHLETYTPAELAAEQERKRQKDELTRRSGGQPMSPNLTPCAGCGRQIDLDAGAGCTDEAGAWWHEDCADARDENDANAADMRD